MKKETYKEDDMVLPIMNLQKLKKVRVVVEVTDDEVSLQVGARDWQWSRKTGELLGCGTFLG